MNGQAVFRKDRGTQDQITNIKWITEEGRESKKKKIILSLLTTARLLCRSYQNVSYITANQSVRRSNYSSEEALQ